MLQKLPKRYNLGTFTVLLTDNICSLVWGIFWFGFPVKKTKKKNSWSTGFLNLLIAYVYFYFWVLIVYGCIFTI